MLYFLLIIIAIGVLLASAEGKELLNVLWKLALIAGGLYLAFWIVMFAIAFFTSNTGKDFANGAFQIIVSIFILIALYYGGNYLVKAIKRDVKAIKDKEKRAEIKAKIKNNWREHKARFILMIVLILIIITCWLILPIFVFNK